MILYCDQLERGGSTQFRQGILDYTELVKRTAIKERLFKPLIVFVDGRLGAKREAHHTVAWQLLQGLLDNDPAPWPANEPKDPTHPMWSFCFNGIPLFFNISSPAHRVLRSRCLCSFLNLVVNPRENFDVVASVSDKGGQLVRKKIRERVRSYNAGFVPNELGFFGEEGNCEWRQYQLGEPGLPGPAACPLTVHSAGQNSDE